MEIRIGVQNVAREIVFESDQAQDEVLDTVRKALSEGTPLELTDKKGRTVIVPNNVVGYVDAGKTTAGPIGFVAG